MSKKKSAKHRGDPGASKSDNSKTPEKPKSKVTLGEIAIVIGVTVFISMILCLALDELTANEIQRRQSYQERSDISVEMETDNEAAQSYANENRVTGIPRFNPMRWGIAFF